MNPKKYGCTMCRKPYKLATHITSSPIYTICAVGHGCRKFEVGKSDYLGLELIRKKPIGLFYIL